MIIAQRGGAATSFLDPNIKNTMTSEISAWLEHELMPGFGVQGGYVYRGIDNFQRASQREPADVGVQRADHHS